jgi:transposase, IS30 family
MKTQTRKPFKHLTQYERDRIERLHFHLSKAVDIARILGRDKGTISRELKRYTNKHHRYKATKAHKTAQERRTGSKVVGMKIERNAILKQRIIRELKQLRAPDEIAGRMKRDGVLPRVGTNAIYKWLYSDYGSEYCQYLCTRKTHKIKQSRLSKRHLIPNRVSIRQRPEGDTELHAESDLFVSPTKLHSSTVGHLTVIPQTLLLTGVFLPNKSPKTMVASIHHIETQLPVTTWTLDNGIENIYHEQFGVPAYFCTKGSPWQKPHVENSIGLIRRWFIPKGTNLATIPEETFQSMLHVFNHKYRRSMGYASAYELSIERDIIKKVPRLSKQSAVAFR